jgi:hypothetical protein
LSNTNSPASINTISKWEYLCEAEPLGLRSIEVYKDGKDDGHSEKDVSNLCTKVGGVGIDDIRNAKGNDPAGKDLGEKHDTLDGCAKRKSTDFRSTGDADRTD